MIPGPKLRAFRENRFVTQRQVADGLGTTPQNVSNVERTASVGLVMAERYLNAVAKAIEKRGQGFIPYRFEIRVIVDGDPGAIVPHDALDLIEGWRSS
jgi:transcriptional regulator